MPLPKMQNVLLARNNKLLNGVIDMPKYVYKCDKCDIEFEVFQHFEDQPLTKCKSCSGNVRRLIQQTHVTFKGSGFYINDSKGVADGKDSE